MARGRPKKGPKLVEGLEGSGEAKKRLEVVLETVAGKITIEQACETLGIGRTAFHKLRARVLQTALEDLEPKPLGRPPREVPEEAAKLSKLETEIEQLRMQLEIAHVREEVMLTMPHLFEPLKEAKKKARKGPTPEKKRRSKKRRR